MGETGTLRRWTAWTCWPDETVGPFHVGMTWTASAEELPTLVGVEVWTVPPDERVRSTDGPPVSMADQAIARHLWPDGFPLTASAVRSLPLGRIISHSRRALTDGFAAEDPRASVEAPERRVRRSIYDDAHWQHVATIYAEALGAGQPPLRAVREQMHVSKPCAAKWVARVRSLGLLPATTRGRPMPG